MANISACPRARPNLEVYSARRSRRSFANVARSSSQARSVGQDSFTSSLIQRGFTCKCKWKTSCPAAAPSERTKLIPSQPVDTRNAIAACLAATKISALASSSSASRFSTCVVGATKGCPSSDKKVMIFSVRERMCPGASPAMIEQKIQAMLYLGIPYFSWRAMNANTG